MLFIIVILLLDYPKNMLQWSITDIMHHYVSGLYEGNSMILSRVDAFILIKKCIGLHCAMSVFPDY